MCAYILNCGQSHHFRTLVTVNEMLTLPGKSADISFIWCTDKCSNTSCLCIWESIGQNECIWVKWSVSIPNFCLTQCIQLSTKHWWERENINKLSGFLTSTCTGKSNCNLHYCMVQSSVWTVKLGSIHYLWKNNNCLLPFAAEVYYKNTLVNTIKWLWSLVSYYCIQ